MDIGAGIFFGLIFIGLVWLYVSTRERWRWKRIGVWCATIVVVPLLGVTGWVKYLDYQASQPRFLDSLWGLSPGMTPEDVVFRKGEPYKKNEKDEIAGESWVYVGEASEAIHEVLWKNGKVRSIEALTLKSRPYGLPSIPGIDSSDSLEEVQKKLGPPDAVSMSKDNTSRMVSFLRYGLFLRLEKNRVTAVGVLDPKEGPIRCAPSMGAILGVQVPGRAGHSEASESQLREGDRAWGGSEERKP